MLERNVAITQSERTQAALDDINQTISWKITKPVRRVKSLFRRTRSGRVTLLSPRRHRLGLRRQLVRIHVRALGWPPALR